MHFFPLPSFLLCPLSSTSFYHLTEGSMSQDCILSPGFDSLPLSHYLLPSPTENSWQSALKQTGIEKTPWSQKPGFHLLNYLVSPLMLPSFSSTSPSPVRWPFLSPFPHTNLLLLTPLELQHYVPDHPLHGCPFYPTWYLYWIYAILLGINLYWTVCLHWHTSHPTCTLTMQYSLVLTQQVNILLTFFLECLPVSVSYL